MAPELAAVVDRCLEKEREDRYADVAQLAEALAPLFPNRRAAAELVAGSLRSHAAVTLHDDARERAAMANLTTHQLNAKGAPLVPPAKVRVGEASGEASDALPDELPNKLPALTTALPQVFSASSA